MGFWNALAAFGGQMMNNYIINKQLSAQAAENEKNRQYNLKLAQMQNQWNIQQWNNENAYNSPSAQMERMKQAGLNPDMMYGGGVSGNLAANSPQMTSGAPSSPMDWSALGNKKTLGQTIMDSLAIEQARANVEKTKSETKGNQMTNDVREQMINKGMIVEEAEYDLLREQINKVFNEAKSIDFDNTEKRVMSNFYDKYESKIVENMLQRLETSTKMSANELKQDIETLTLRIAGINAENAKLDRLSKFGTDEKRLVFDIIVELLKAMK